MVLMRWKGHLSQRAEIQDMDDVMAARIEIAALIAELTNLGDAGSIDAFAKLFAHNGVYTLQDGTSATGPSEIERMLTEFSKNMQTAPNAPTYMRHNISTSHVEVLGNGAASGDTYFLNVNDKGLDHWGRWQDRFTRADSKTWLFASRKVVLEGMIESSWLKTPG